MTESWMPPLGGTQVQGPVAEWSNPDGRWTDEFGAAVKAAHEAQRPVACPVCGNDVDSVDAERVYGMHELRDGVLETIEGDLGWLFTLGPCGHKLAK